MVWVLGKLAVAQLRLDLGKPLFESNAFLLELGVLRSRVGHGSSFAQDQGIATARRDVSPDGKVFSGVQVSRSIRGPFISSFLTTGSDGAFLISISSSRIDLTSNQAASRPHLALRVGTVVQIAIQDPRQLVSGSKRLNIGGLSDSGCISPGCCVPPGSSWFHSGATRRCYRERR